MGLRGYFGKELGVGEDGLARPTLRAESGSHKSLAFFLLGARFVGEVLVGGTGSFLGRPNSGRTVTGEIRACPIS
jgi:hypothetical protein